MQDFGTHRDGSRFGMRLQPGGGACEEGGMPGVIVVVQGEVFAVARVQTFLRAAATAEVLRQVQYGDFLLQGGWLGGKEGVHSGGVAAIVDHERLPVGEGLRGNVGERAGEKRQTVFTADDDGDFCHVISLLVVEKRHHSGICDGNTALLCYHSRPVWRSLCYVD